MIITSLRKKTSLLILFLFPLILAASEEPTETLAQKLCKKYKDIKSITCEIRKTTTAGKTVRMLSRIHYESPLRIHIENVSPVRRRIISDGKTLYYHEKGQPKGFSRPINKLAEPWAASINNVPATPVEHLLPLLNIPESTLKGTKDFPTRKAYQAEKVYVILCLDSMGRLTQIEFFKSDKMKTMTAKYNYSEFKKAAPDCWIPEIHKALMYMPDGSQISETRIIDNLQINEPVPGNLFKAHIFFKDVEFVDDFEKTYR